GGAFACSLDGIVIGTDCDRATGHSSMSTYFSIPIASVTLLRFGRLRECSDFLKRFPIDQVVDPVTGGVPSFRVDFRYLFSSPHFRNGLLAFGCQFVR